MCQLLIVRYFNTNPNVPDSELEDLPSLSDLQRVVDLELHEADAFNDGIVKIEFFVRVDNHFHLSKVIER